MLRAQRDVFGAAVQVSGGGVELFDFRLHTHSSCCRGKNTPDDDDDKNCIQVLYGALRPTLLAHLCPVHTCAAVLDAVAVSHPFSHACALVLCHFRGSECPRPDLAGATPMGL